MAYTKTVWQVEEGVNLNRFTKSSESTDYVTLSRAPSSISQAGTTFSVANMNNIENGIETLDNTVTSYLNQAVLTTSSPTFAGLSVAPNTDITASIGRGKLGLVAGFGDNFGIGHYDNFTGSNYAFIAGTLLTTLNAKSGGYVDIRNNNTQVAAFKSDAINMYQPVLINTTTDNGVDKLQVNGSISADSVSVSGSVIGDSIDVGNVAIKMKAIAGLTDGSGSEETAHGLTSSKILSVNALIYNGTVWVATDTTLDIRVYFTSTNVVALCEDSSFYNRSIKFMILYEA